MTIQTYGVTATSSTGCTLNAEPKDSDGSAGESPAYYKVLLSNGTNVIHGTIKATYATATGTTTLTETTSTKLITGSGYTGIAKYLGKSDDNTLFYILLAVALYWFFVMKKGRI